MEPIPPISPTPPQPPVPPFVPLTPQVKKSPKLLYLLLVLIFLAASSFFAYKYLKLKQQLAQLSPIPSTTTMPTTDLTASWKTYTNTEYKYSIKYPSDMVLEQNTEDPFYPSYVIFTNEANQFNIRATESTVLATTETIRSQTEGHVLAELIKNETMQVNNVTARLLEYTIEDQNSNRSTLIIPSGKNVIIINAQSDIFDQILSTLKFTN